MLAEEKRVAGVIKTVYRNEIDIRILGGHSTKLNITTMDKKYIIDILFFNK